MLFTFKEFHGRVRTLSCSPTVCYSAKIIRCFSTWLTVTSHNNIIYAGFIALQTASLGEGSYGRTCKCISMPSCPRNSLMLAKNMHSKKP